MTRKLPSLLAATAVAGLLLASGFATETKAATYGCFQVTTGSLNIRDRPRSNATVIGVASRGEILEKRKLICTPRGYWCAIRKGSLEGYADKNFMRRVTCP